MKHDANTRKPKAANGINPAISSTRRESFGRGAAQIAVQSVVKSTRRVVSMTSDFAKIRSGLCFYRHWDVVKSLLPKGATTFSPPGSGFGRRAVPPRFVTPEPGV